MGDLRTLARRLEKRANAMPEDANRVKIETAKAIVNDLIEVTPVDESTALSNWQVGVGEPVPTAIKAYVAGKKGSSEGVSEQAAKNAALAKLEAVKPGETIYLSNVLKYIRRLNDGSSGQAPAGFVERAVLLGRKLVRGAKLRK